MSESFTLTPDSSDQTRTTLLHQALIQARTVRTLQNASKSNSNEILLNSEPINGSNQLETTSLIKAHLLFPILERLLLQCDSATYNISSDCADIDAIVEILTEYGNSGRSISTNNESLDGLMYGAVLVFKVHLLELAKVAQLCDNFRNKYLQTIKQKINQETLLGLVVDSDDDFDNFGESNGELNSNQSDSNSVAMVATSQGTVGIPMELYRKDHRKNNNNNSTENTYICPTSNQLLLDDDCFNFEIKSQSGKKSALPKKAVDSLKAWLFQHVSHPYPNETEKAYLSNETGLNIIQVNNWFINARRRILQPMLEDSPQISNKNSKSPVEIKEK